jgi:hypothetical protein
MVTCYSFWRSCVAQRKHRIKLNLMLVKHRAGLKASIGLTEKY